MSDDTWFGATAGFIIGMILCSAIYSGLRYPVPKIQWECTKLSQPTKIGEEVECLQYSKEPTK